jgi:hypothetical protein
MEIERLPFGQSPSDKLRAAHYKWVNMPSGLTPELASKFRLGLHGGKTIRDMTTAGGRDYICSDARFPRSGHPWQAHHPEGGMEMAPVRPLHENVSARQRRDPCRGCREGPRGPARRERISTILNTIMRPPTYNLLRQRDPSINLLIEETKPLRASGGAGSRGGWSHTREYKREESRRAAPARNIDAPRATFDRDNRRPIRSSERNGSGFITNWMKPMRTPLKNTATAP